MRQLKAYKIKEWLALQPIVDAFKQFRNDTNLRFYCKRIPDGHSNFLAETMQRKNTDNIVIAIAYECPDTISLLINSFNKNIKNSLLIIVDNSPTAATRQKIKKVCNLADIPYFALPSNPTRHANRSHGMSVQWSYQNIVKAIKPTIFTFVDHDLIPKKTYDFKEVIGNKPFYGVLWNSTKSDAWQLWAGFSTFNYQQISKYKLNFLYDFSNGLDTGGRNYFPLYQYHKIKNLNFASNVSVHFKANMNSSINGYIMQVIDDCWVHMGGAGHLENYELRQEKFNEQMQALDKIGNWSIHSSEHFTNIEPIRH